MSRVLVLFFCICLFSVGQARPKFNKTSQIDTLNVWLTISDSIQKPYRLVLMETFQNRVSKHNNDPDKQFHIRLDPTNSEHHLTLALGPITYITPGMSIWTTALDMGLLALDIAMWSNGIPILIYPFLIPHTNAVIAILNSSESVFSAKNKSLILPMGSSAYFTKLEKQKFRFNRKFGKRVDRFLRKLNRQQAKNAQQRVNGPIGSLAN